MPTCIEDITDEHMSAISSDVDFRARVIELISDDDPQPWLSETEELINNDENHSVEFKQTARWNVREERKDKLMEEIVAKTVAGFQNSEGGILVIGVHDDKYPVGLKLDLPLVTPPTLDGYVNWLDTMLENSLGHAGARRLRISIVKVGEHDICRIDVPRSSRPIWVTFKGDRKLFERRNNSTRAVPEDQWATYIADHIGIGI